MYLQRFFLVAHPIIYFFFVDARVEGREDCWDRVRGGWGEWGCAVDAWEGARFDMLVLTGLSAGVWDSPALARDADRSSARIFSRVCFSSVSARMALSSAVCARSFVSLILEKKTSYSSLHNRRFMSQARRTRHFARIGRRGEEKNSMRLLPVRCSGSSHVLYMNVAFQLVNCGALFWRNSSMFVWNKIAVTQSCSFDDAV